jgi:hypothetical protein
VHLTMRASTATSSQPIFRCRSIMVRCRYGRDVNRCQRSVKELIDASMLCACCCVDVPQPDASPRPRVTSDGHRACERCGKQLSKVKHVHRHGAGHACHPRCKTPPTAPSSANTALITPPRSHKRKESPAGQLQVAPAVRIAPPLPPLSWDTHGSPHRPSSRRTRSIRPLPPLPSCLFTYA